MLIKYKLKISEKQEEKASPIVSNITFSPVVKFK